MKWAERTRPTRSMAAVMGLAVTVATLAPTSGLPAEAAQGNGFEMPPVEISGPKQLGDVGFPMGNFQTQRLGSQELARIEILHTRDEVDVTEFVVSMGGIVEGTAAGRLVQALYPIDALDELAGFPGVETVRRPTLLTPAPRVATPTDLDFEGLAFQAATMGEEVLKTNAAAWHRAGYTGRGVRVGIIDGFSFDLWQAAIASGDLPNYKGAFSSINGTVSYRFPDAGVDGGFHGVGVAEIVHEMAPSAELFVVSARTAADLQAAVDYLYANDVDIITRSQGAVFDGPGDGTGVLADVQRDAIRKGMVWLNSAGNHAGPVGDGGYWRSSWIDTDLDGWLEFGGVTELMETDCGFFQGFRWNDWGTNRTDYDIYVFEDIAQAASFNPNDASTFKASSVDDQAAGAYPLESPDWVCDGKDPDYLAVLRYGGGPSTGDVLEMAVNAGRFQFSSNPYSAGQPFSDSNVAGALSVGAIDPAFGTAIAGYSSRGPSNDLRVKPDVSAASCVSGLAFAAVGYPCFNGTSAATPAVAGALALVLESGLATTPTELHYWLVRNAIVDRGPAGPDNTFGHGEVVLPNPPVDFVDDDDSVFEDDIEWLAQRGITQGCNPPTRDRFCPDDEITRGQMAAFLHRALPNLPTSGSFDFRDDDDSLFEGDIEWLARAGVTRGCGTPTANIFCPGDPVTRGQMAAFLARALDLPPSAGDWFRDDDTSVFEDDIERLAAAGITRGCDSSGANFCPEATVTRGEMAAFLHRAFTG